MLILLDKMTFVMEGILLYVYYQTLFGRRKQGISRVWFVAGFIMAQVVYDVATNFLIGNTSPGATFLRFFLTMGLNFLLTLYYAASIPGRLFAIISYSALYAIAEQIAYYIFSYVTGIQENMNRLSDWSFTAIAYVCDLLLLFFIMVLHVVWKRRAGVRSARYSVLLIVIPALSCTVGLVPPSFRLALTNPGFYLMLVAFLFVINMVNYVLLENVLKAEDLEKKTKVLNEQIIYQNQKYSQLGEAYKNIRSFMHDTKKHFFYIEKCVEEENYDQIIPYAHKTISDLESRYCTVNTGNLVIDAFVSNYILQTGKYGIAFTTSLKVNPKQIPVDDYHLTIILGNLLDNALNASKDQINPKIVLKIQIVENAFAIYISNSYVVPLNEKRPERIEEIDFIHGYGLDNVKKSVKECGGVTSIKYEDDVYSVATVFPFRGDTWRRL